MERLMCAPRVRLMVPCLKVNSHAPGLVCPPFPSCTHIPVRGGTVSFPLLSPGLRPSPSVPHQTKLGCVPLRCSTRWRLRSSPRFSRRRPPPGLKATPPSNLRLRSLVRVVSLSRTILSSLISRVRCRRSQSGMHGVQLRSRSLGHRQRIPPNMAACIRTFD